MLAENEQVASCLLILINSGATDANRVIIQALSLRQSLKVLPLDMLIFYLWASVVKRVFMSFTTSA